MGKFNDVYNKYSLLKEGMPAELAAAGYERMPQNTSLNQMSPQQQADVSKAITDILNKLPKSVNSVSGPVTNIPVVANAVEKIKTAGSNALNVIGNMTVKDILAITKKIVTAPIQVQQAALGNLRQASIKTGQDIANILTNIAKQKGASEQEIQKILNDIEREQRIDSYMKG